MHEEHCIEKRKNIKMRQHKKTKTKVKREERDDEDEKYDSLIVKQFFCSTAPNHFNLQSISMEAAPQEPI